VNYQRSESRRGVAARVQICWKDQKGAAQVTQGMLEDISPSGAGIRIAKAINVGSRLDVRWHKESFSGTVKHCRPAGFDFVLGIQKDPAQDC
jgi:hypothetical protein